MVALALLTGALAAAPAYAAVAQSFAAPAANPTSASSNYVGKSNSTLQSGPTVPGKAFDRMIQIWLENTDYETAASSPVFQNLTKQGLLLSGYHGNTHPSEPNYAVAGMGDFFGMHDDAFYAFPKNTSSIADLLEAKNISWASYQENMPYDGYTGFNYTEQNYLNTSAGEYTYYVRKHSPLILTDSVAGVQQRALRHRNFNDFAADVNASALPQWVFITPNLVNDAHDSTIDYTSSWLEYFLVPLLQNPNFVGNSSLVLLTFDETETYSVNNRVYTLLLGSALPEGLVGQTDPTYYTHCSTLSTVEANWGLGSLGRCDTNKTLANVFDFVANKTGYVNNGLTINSTDLPLTNLTGVFPGPANTNMWTPILAPNVSAVGAGGGSVFVSNGTNTSLTSYAPQNLTAMGVKNPATIDPGYDYSSGSLVVQNSSASSSSASPSATATGKVATASGTSGAAGLVVPMSGLLAVAAGVAALI